MSLMCLSKGVINEDSGPDEVANFLFFTFAHLWLYRLKVIQGTFTIDL